MAYDPKKLKETLAAIKKQKPIIEANIKKVLEGLTLETLPDYSLVELTEKLKVCHPYLAFLNMSILSKQGKIGTHYLLITNEAVHISLYKHGLVIIRVYAVSTLNQMARIKYAK